MSVATFLNLFERSMPEGWIYPCTLEDIRESLAQLPQPDIEGLWAAGLVPETRKDNESYARYYFEPKPTIQIFSYPSSFCFKLRANTKMSEINKQMKIEQHYGMDVIREGSRFVCAWSPENLRRFVVEHVLLHEVGHHVFFWHRKRQGYTYSQNVAGAEQFAEDYALRHRHR